jgi:hypothetical protein
MESPVHPGTIRSLWFARNGTHGCGTPSTASQESIPEMNTRLEEDLDTTTANFYFDSILLRAAQQASCTGVQKKYSNRRRRTVLNILACKCHETKKM